MSSDPEEEPAFKLSRASAEDLLEIQALAREIWVGSYPGIISLPQIEYMLGRMYDPVVMEREMSAEGVVYLRIHVGELVRGFAAFGPGDNDGEVFLHKLYLHPDCHGRGIGSGALAEIEAMVLEERFGGRILLRVNKRNRKAINAYERNGYAITESVCSDIGSGFVMDDYRMRKELGFRRPE